MTAGTRPPGLASVVIPCYNQGRYLTQAIDSALCQSYPHVEIIVVDDGSDEDLQAITRTRPSVRYVRQPNSGVSAARNLGFRYSKGDFVLFLDSDDRLTPHAITFGLQAIASKPDAAAAVGLCRIIGPAGEPRPFHQPVKVDSDVYLALLRGNFIWMPAQVLYRREHLEQAGGFDPTVDACADYDLYLRVARRWPLVLHTHIVADYRKHDGNMSRQSCLMLASALRVLSRQSPYLQREPAYRHAAAVGRRFWRAFYGEEMVAEIRIMAHTRGRRLDACRELARLLRYDPSGFLAHVSRKLALVAGALVTRRRKPV